MKLLGNHQSRYVHKILESIAKNDPSTVNVVLNGFAINEKKLAMLAMSLVGNEHVRSLYLHNIGISAKGAILLASALRYNKTLEHLSLNDNNIGSEGCAAIAAALHENHTLVTLGLSNNAITSHGAKQLSKMLKEHHEQTSIARIFLDGNDDISEKVLNKIDRYCIKARAQSCRSSNKSHASTSPCSDVGSHTSSQHDHHRNVVSSKRANYNESTAESRKAEYDLFKDVIGYESVNSLHRSLNASNLASYIERVHKDSKLEDELGPEYFASDTDLGTSFLSTVNDKHDCEKEQKKEKHTGYFKAMKWTANRKVHIDD